MQSAIVISYNKYMKTSIAFLFMLFHSQISLKTLISKFHRWYQGITVRDWSLITEMEGGGGEQVNFYRYKMGCGKSCGHAEELGEGGGGNKLWGGLYTRASSFSHTEVLRNVVSLIKMSFHQVQSVSVWFCHRLL